MKQKFQNLGLILSRDAQKKLVGGDGDGSCVATTCEAKSTSSKSCKCSTAWDKCLCTTVYGEEEA